MSPYSPHVDKRRDAAPLRPRTSTGTLKRRVGYMQYSQKRPFGLGRHIMNQVVGRCKRPLDGADSQQTPRVLAVVPPRDDSVRSQEHVVASSAPPPRGPVLQDAPNLVGVLVDQLGEVARSKMVVGVRADEHLEHLIGRKLWAAQHTQRTEKDKTK